MLLHPSYVPYLFLRKATCKKVMVNICIYIYICPIYIYIHTNHTRSVQYHSNTIHAYERPPKPPTFWNSYTRTLILDTIMKLSGTIGVTQKTMTLDTHVRLILLQTLNPQERWGTHKKRWPFQPRLFADVIGLVRCSYVYMYLFIHTHILATYATYSEIGAGTQKGRWNTSSQPFQVTAFVAPATSRPEMTHQVLDVWVEIVWMWMWCRCGVFVSLFFWILIWRWVKYFIG